MKAALFALFAAALLPVSALQAQTPTPFVETTTLTFFWGFSETYVTSTDNAVPALPDDAVFDPLLLPDGFESYIYTGRARAYTGPVSNTFPPAGANKQIIELLLQRMVREREIAKQILGYRWQLIAVRDAPANVQEAATNPYTIFLSGQHPTSSLSFSLPVKNIGPEILDDEQTVPPLFPPTIADTGMTLTLGSYSGSFTESKWNEANNIARSATGTVSTAFTVDFGAVFYEDPKHNVDQPRQDPFNYHLKRNIWRASAAGLVNYTFRPIAQNTLPTFLVSSSGATGTGWFFHDRQEIEYKNNLPVLVNDITKNYLSGGTAPLRINLSTIQYQKRTIFYPIAPSALAAVVTGVIDEDNATVSLSWNDNSFNETGFYIQRKDNITNTWSVVYTFLNQRPDPEVGDEQPYVDTVVPNVSYTYRVQAFNVGPSTYSNEATATPTAVPAP